jgi:hypothetical protein
MSDSTHPDSLQLGSNGTLGPELWARRHLFSRLLVDDGNMTGTIHTLAAERVREILATLASRHLPCEYPAQLQINLNSYCSRKSLPRGDCINCAFPNNQPLHVGIARLIADLSQFVSGGGISVFLSGGGEPGDYQHLEELLIFLSEHALGRKLELTLNTNGAFIRRIAELALTPGDQGLAWRTRLRTIFSGQKNGSPVLSMISLSWHDDAQAQQALQLLSALRAELGLKTVIRVSSLVYSDPQVCIPQRDSRCGYVGGSVFDMTTAVEQVMRIMDLARDYGADTISFKAAHTNTDGVRVHVLNEPVYQYLKSRIDEQLYVAQMCDWNWEIWRDANKSDFVLELSPRLNRLSRFYQEALARVRSDGVFCVAPLVMTFLSPRGIAACCNLWDDGLGTPPLILTGALDPPHLYYTRTLYSMLTWMAAIGSKYCVSGCGWTELNLANPLKLWATGLLNRYAHDPTCAGELWEEIREHFTPSSAWQIGCRDPTPYSLPPGHLASPVRVERMPSSVQF